MSEIVIASIYVALSAGIGWGLTQYADFAPITAGLAAAVACLTMLQLRGAFIRARDMQSIEDDLESLRSANRSMRKALDDSKKGMAEVAHAIVQRSEKQEKKVVGGLQLIETLVRDFAAKAAAKPAPAARHDFPVAANVTLPSPPPDEIFDEPHAEPTMLELIQRALEENRVDLYLQPIVTLPQRKVRFFEALTRLRFEDGAVIMPEQFIRIAAPAGLMSVVDNLLLFRCVQVIRRLTQKSRDVAVFCNISGHTLKDAEFFPQFLDFLHQHRDLSSQIVFEFAAESILEAGPEEEANLQYLAQLGFRLSLDQVSRLDLDFARLKWLGFTFVKVRAETLIFGMRDARAQVAAEDLRDLLSRNGIDLIVEHVEDEKAVVQLLEFNVNYGQGYLFGEPKPMRESGDGNEPRVKEAANSDSLPEPPAIRLAS